VSIGQSFNCGYSLFLNGELGWKMILDKAPKSVLTKDGRKPDGFGRGAQTVKEDDIVDCTFFCELDVPQYLSPYFQRRLPIPKLYVTVEFWKE